MLAPRRRSARRARRPAAVRLRRSQPALVVGARRPSQSSIAEPSGVRRRSPVAGRRTVSQVRRGSRRRPPGEENSRFFSSRVIRSFAGPPWSSPGTRRGVGVALEQRVDRRVRRRCSRPRSARRAPAGKRGCPSASADSSFSRRTMTSLTAAGSGSTPRAKRCGSSISSRACQDSLVAVVRGGGQEQPVLAVLAEPADSLRLQAVHGVAAALRRRGGATVVRLVDDQQVEEARVAGRPACSTSSSSRCTRGVRSHGRLMIVRGCTANGFACRPWVRRSCPQRGGVQDGEVQAELLRHLVAPLAGQRRRADHQDAPGAVAQQQLLHDEPGLDRLAQPDVVGDQQVDPGHAQRLGHRFQLVVLDGDAGAERRLQGVDVGAGDGAPPDGVEERAKRLRVVPAGLCDVGQRGRREDLAARFDLPHDRQLVAQVVVADAGQRHQRATGQGRGASSSRGWVLVLSSATTHCCPRARTSSPTSGAISITAYTSPLGSGLLHRREVRSPTACGVRQPDQ